MRALLAVLVSLCLVASAASADPVKLHRGNIAEPDSLDPHKWNLTYEQEITDDIFLGLMTLDADANPIPGAAESYTTSPDGIVWTFTLRAGLVWSDGVPVTAEDYAAGMRRMFDPKTAAPSAEFAYLIKNAAAVNKGEAAPDTLGVRAIDDRTLEVTLERPSPLLLQISTFPILFPLPRHVYERVGDAWVKPGNMVGNGPFTLSEWRPNDYVKLVKNPLFYDAANVKLDEIYYYPTDDDAAALQRFRAGSLDMNWRFPQAKYDWLKANMPESTFVGPSIWVNYLVINQNLDKFKDARVRRALSMAIDRESLVQITKTNETPAYRFVPTAIPGYTEKAGFDYRNMDKASRQAEAKELLAASGFGPDNPLSFTLRIRAGEVNKRVGVAVQDAWREIGVNAQISASDVKTHYALLRARDFEVGDGGYSAPNDPEYFMWQQVSSRKELNYGDYSNPEFDRLAAQAAMTLDIPERYRLFAEAEDISLRETGFIPLFFFSSRNLVAPYVKGFKVNAPDQHPSRWLSIER